MLVSDYSHVPGYLSKLKEMGAIEDYFFDLGDPESMWIKPKKTVMTTINLEDLIEKHRTINYTRTSAECGIIFREPM